MRHIILITLLLVSSFAKASNSTTGAAKLLECSEKYSYFSIEQGDNDTYEITRSVMTDRARGSLYVAGTVSTESNGMIKAKLISATANDLNFALDNGNYITFTIAEGIKSEIVELKITSNETKALSRLNDLLKTQETPLDFIGVDACKITTGK